MIGEFLEEKITNFPLSVVNKIERIINGNCKND
jgi:hypothetical protein